MAENGISVKDDLVAKQEQRLADSFVPAALLRKAQLVAGVDDLAPFKAAEFFFAQLNIPKDRPQDLAQCIAVCAEYKLNPLLKHIYGFKNQNGAWVPIVGIDGWLHIANSHPQFDGMDVEFIEREGTVHSCRCTIYRKDRNRPVVVEEFLSENLMNTTPWKQRPRRMLSHRARAQAIRSAFGVSGVWHDLEPEEVREAEAAEVRPTVRQSNERAVKLATLATPQATRVVNTQATVSEPNFATEAANDTDPEPDHDIDPDASELGPMTDAEKLAIEREEADRLAREEEAERAAAGKKQPSLNDLRAKARSGVGG